MTADRSPGADLFEGALVESAHAKMASTSETRSAHRVQVIESCEKALSLGLTKREEVECLALLGRSRLEHNVGPRLQRLEALGLSALDEERRGIETIEESLKRDRDLGDAGPFRMRDQRENAFLYVDSYWTAHARYLEQSTGTKAAIAYLEGRLSLIAHVPGTFMPYACEFLGSAYGMLDADDAAAQWLRRAVHAEDYPEYGEQAKSLAKRKLLLYPGGKGADVNTGPTAEGKTFRGSWAVVCIVGFLLVASIVGLFSNVDGALLSVAVWGGVLAFYLWRKYR